MDWRKVKTLAHRLGKWAGEMALKSKQLFVTWVRIPKGSPWWMKILLTAIYSLAFALLFLLAIDVNFLWLFGRSPRIGELRNPDINLTSTILSADKKVMGTLFTEYRTEAAYSELPTHLVLALIATEDIRFYKHHGIDFRATVAALWSTAQGDRRGGSTITQQLVKNLFKTRNDYSKGLFSYIPGVGTLIYKLKEWINAFKIEMYYSKPEIIALYFNTVDFGNHAFGINSASSIYFGVQTRDLNINQSATLVGMLKAPTYYSPVSQPSRATKRRNQVIGQMVKYRFLLASTGDSVKKLPLGLHFQRKNLSKGEPSFLRDAIVRFSIEWCRKNGYDVWTDGLKIYTSIDSRMQKYAEASAGEQMARLQRIVDAGGKGVAFPWIDPATGREIPDYFLKAALSIPEYASLLERYHQHMDSVKIFLSKRKPMKVFAFPKEKTMMFSILDSIRYSQKIMQTGFVAIEPASGDIKAWVGGVSYKYFKFDHVDQSQRQPGSLFKAFVYAAAMDNGYGPCDRMTDQSVSIQYTEDGMTKQWQPKNVDRSHAGNMTLKHAFARSVNSIAVQLAQAVGWHKTIEYAQKLGIHSPLANVPSICLGSSDVNLLEMVCAYCTFVNGGKQFLPTLITRIEDKNGNVLYQADHGSKQVLSPETAFMMQVLLRGGLTEPGGTTQGLFEYDLFRQGAEFGGKTGTSSDYADGWFIGVSPGLVAGSWVGNDNPNIHFTTSHLGEGLHTAQPIYGRFMEKVMNDAALKKYRQKFQKPGFKLSKPYDCQTVAPKRDTTAIQKVDSIQN